MEEVEKDPEEASGPSVMSENPEAQSGASTQEAEKDPSMGVREEVKGKERQLHEEVVKESRKLIIPRRIIDLQRDLQMSVTNIEIAAVAKESMRRKEVDEARRLRLERLENDVKSSQEKFGVITREWSTAKQNMVPRELWEALKNQQDLCATHKEDKKKLVNYLQQELKSKDDCFIKDLRNQAEDLDLMIERMEYQMKTLTNAYREELAQIERVYQQESEVLLTRDKILWDQHMAEILDKELERLMQRKKTAEEYEARIQSVMVETTDKGRVKRIQRNAKTQVLEKNTQQQKNNKMMMKLSRLREKNTRKVYKLSLAHMKRRMTSQKIQMHNLKAEYTSQDKWFTKMNQCLLTAFKRNIHQYEGVQKKIKNIADVGKFEEMRLTIDAETKQLVEKILVVDSLICERLGLAWERPPMSLTERSHPTQPNKHASESNQSTDAGGAAAQSESGAEVEEEQLKEVMELLCDEAGFLIDDHLLHLLGPLEKEEEIIVTLSSLLHSFGIEERDFPKLAHFLIKHKHQQREQNEDVCVDLGDSSDKAGGNSSTSGLTDPNHLMPALKGFLEELTRSRESSAYQHPSFQGLYTPEDEAFWESMGNIISEDKLKLWDEAEKQLEQYHEVLNEISELLPETESLEQQNKELRTLLQQYLISAVSTEQETA